MSDRILEVLKKAQIMLSTINDPVRKNKVSESIEAMMAIYNYILENKIPCPPHLEEKVNKTVASIEALYNKTVSN